MTKTRRVNGDGSIFKNSQNGKYVAQYRTGTNEDGKPTFKKKSFKTKRECEIWLSEIKKQYGGLSQSEYPLLTVSKVLQQWLDFKKRTLKPKSLDRVESTINTHVLPAIGDYKLCEVTPDLIQDAVFDIMVNDKNLSKSSVKKAYDDLNNFFNYCVDNDWLNKSPMRRVTLKVYNFKEEKLVKSFTSDEMERIIASATEKYGNGKLFYKCGYIFPVIYHTGLRIGEALGLRWKNVNLDEKFIEISETVVNAKDRSTDSNSRKNIVQDGGKTRNSRRRIPLNKTALEYFLLQRERQQKANKLLSEDLFVFNVAETSEAKPMLAHNVSRSFTIILEKNNIDHRGIHALRHTFATDLKQNGVDELIISRLLGHSESSVTRRYIDTRFDELRKAVDTLAEDN